MSSRGSSSSVLSFKFESIGVVAGLHISYRFPWANQEYIFFDI
jgi:hypothetical protein